MTAVAGVSRGGWGHTPHTGVKISGVGGDGGGGCVEGWLGPYPPYGGKNIRPIY